MATFLTCLQNTSGVLAMRSDIQGFISVLVTFIYIHLGYHLLFRGHIHAVQVVLRLLASPVVCPSLPLLAGTLIQFFPPELCGLLLHLHQILPGLNKLHQVFMPAFQVFHDSVKLFQGILLLSWPEHGSNGGPPLPLKRSNTPESTKE